MPQEYSQAPEVKDVADDLIDLYHSHLATVRIDYVFVSETLREKGKDVWGRAKKVSGLNAWLADPGRDNAASVPDDFFVIEIAKAIWLQLDDKSRKALVDHELHHLDVDLDTGKLSLHPHDLEEFNGIVRRYGLWRADVEMFLEAAKQKEQLFDEEDDTRVTLIHGDREVDITDHLERTRRREATA